MHFSMDDEDDSPAHYRLDPARHAVFAAGCFWGVQAIFDDAPGVKYSIVGYVGGDDKRWPLPDYDQVCSHMTGHLEGILVEFDPDVTDFADLLELFLRLHDPSQAGGQGPDIGPQYESAVFALDDMQSTIARDRILELEAAQHFAGPIQTRVFPLSGEFWQAESEHQKYFKRRAITHTGCHYLRPELPRV